MIEFNHPLIALFVFAIGACVGSFLNVVVYRMPLGKSLVTPPSACPKCGHGLAWHDNVPVFGWLWLRGKCRYCQNPISVRYPIVELITGLLFAGHYLLLFHYGWGPYEMKMLETPYGTFQAAYRLLDLERDWPILAMHLWLIAALLAASLIDLEHYIIPLELCWWTAGVGVVFHALGRPDGSLGNLHFPPGIDAMTLGAGLGLLLSIGFLRFGWLRRSFEDDAPLLEVELAQMNEEDRPDPWPPARVRAEIRREMVFVLPVILGAAAAYFLSTIPAVAHVWDAWANQRQISGASARSPAAWSAAAWSGCSASSAATGSGARRWAWATCT
ncbi:MAG: prepilin peptidase [Tepidisphaeraceae bacterium]